MTKILKNKVIRSNCKLQILRVVCLYSKIMRLKSTKNDLVRKTLFPTPKDTERYFLRKDTSEKIHRDTHKRYFFLDSKDTSEKIHKDTYRRYFSYLNRPHHFRQKIPDMYHSTFTTQPCKCLIHAC